MRFHDLANRLELLAFLVFLERFHVRRGRRRRRAEQVLEDERAAQHRRRAIGIRRHHQNRCLAEQTEPVRIGQRDAAELVATHVRDAVMPRKPLVEERVIRRKEIAHAAVFAEDAVEEELHLPADGRAQRRVERGIRVRVRVEARCVAHTQPLEREIRRQRLRTRIGEHAPHLRLERLRRAQLVLLRQRQQLLVWNARPEEERQTRRQLEIAQRVDRPRPGVRGRRLGAIQELGARQHRRQRALDAVLECPRLAAVGVELHQRREIGLRDRTPIRFARQRRDDA